MPEFQESWMSLARVVDRKLGKKNYNTELPDIDHLKRIGAHEKLIAVAEQRPSIDEFNLAPGQKNREYTPDWMFRNSFSIGGDGCGNFVIWMDASKIDSKILFICHDPSEVTILANSPAEFFDHLHTYLSNHEFNDKNSLLYGYLENWKPPTDTSSGIFHTNKNDRDVFDFNVGNIGDTVSLDFRGKYTIVSKSDRAGVLTLKTEEEETVRKIQMRDRIWAVVLVAAIGMVFVFFLQILNKTILASIGWTLLSLIMFSGIFSLTLDAYYSLEEKWQNKVRTNDK